MAETNSGFPARGSVLGVDVGWSLKQRSSAACRLDWTEHSVSWTINRFTAEAEARRSGLLDTIGDRQLEVAAFDGPLRGDLLPIDTYRLAERRLSEQLVREAIGKIAQSNSGNGRLLNAATNACAEVVLASDALKAAQHRHAIANSALVEAFPNSFLGLMLVEPALHKGGRGQRSDRYYKALTIDGTLTRLLQHLLPGRAALLPFASVTNHDDRAALVCALSALCVAAGAFTAVGDRSGWIVLPPLPLVAEWARGVVASWNHALEH